MALDQAQLNTALLEMGRGMIKLAGGDSPGMVSGGRALPSGTPTTSYMTGPGGIFGVAGLADTVIHTIIQGKGLAAALPAVLTNDMNPLVAYVTGVRDVTGSVANGVCDDPPTAGLVKACIGTAQFGRTSFQSVEIEINRLGQRTNRGEFSDLRLLNNPLMNAIGNVTPMLPGGVSSQILSDVSMAWMSLGLAFQRELGREVYTGNPASNSAGGGTKQFPGLDILISTGHRDALTNILCPSLDSDIKNLNYACVGSSGTVNDNIVNTLTYLLRYLKYNASATGLDPATFALVMRPDLFYELTAIWPCTYLTYRCVVSAAAGESVNIDANDAITMRDAMRNGNYIVIDGERVQVILDTFIVEETNTQTSSVASGSFASDIYVVPLTVLGGTPALYWETFNFNAENAAMDAVQQGQLGAHFFTTDGGRFLWHMKPPLNWCIQWLAKIEPRLRLLTPHLAGRLMNVCYSPLQHLRDAHPDDPYFTNGGVVSRTAPSYYTAGWTS